MLPHEYHEFRLFAEGSVIPPEHRLMLVNFHRECIGDAKKAQWDRAISNGGGAVTPCIRVMYHFQVSCCQTLDNVQTTCVNVYLGSMIELREL